MSLQDREIDVVLITHPDVDHIGGLDSILKRFSVKHIIIPDSNDIAEVFKKDSGIIIPPIPSQIVLPDGTGVYFLWGYDEEQVGESNARSLVIRIEHKDTSVLLTGDIPAAVEREMVAMYGDTLQSDILKLSHHGSKTSSDSLFLKTVAPKEVIVSAGESNRYGHPHDIVIERIQTLLPDTNIHHTKDGPALFLL